MMFLRNYLLPTLIKLGPPRFRRFVVDLLPFRNVRQLRDITDVMHNTSVEILEAKRRALLEDNGAVAKQVSKGKDIISILSMYIPTSCHRHAYKMIWSVKANVEALEEDKLPESEVLAQVVSRLWDTLILLMRLDFFL